MSLETGLLAVLALCSAATLVGILLLRRAVTREVRGLRESIDGLQAGGASRQGKPGAAGAAGPDPRLTAARAVAAARAAKRPGRTTVKRI